MSDYSKMSLERFLSSNGVEPAILSGSAPASYSVLNDIFKAIKGNDTLFSYDDLGDNEVNGYAHARESLIDAFLAVLSQICPPSDEWDDLIMRISESLA